MALTLSPVKTNADALASMTHGTAPNPTAHTTMLPRSCLYVWVVGNPISGGKRGATLLDRIEKLFCQSLGRDTVHTTSSSNFLHILSLHQPVQGSPSEGMERGARQHSSEAPSASAWAPTDGSATPHLSAVSALWNATEAAAPATTADCSLSSAASSGSGVALRTCIIRTSECGHSKLVSHALSQLILGARLEDHQLLPQGQVRCCTQCSTCASETVGCDTGVRESPPLNFKASMTYQRTSSTPEQPSTHHVILVVGGDGTLSEVTNGLCEGTLAKFAQLELSSGSCTDCPATTSHAHVEREAAVLSHLLPAVLYVPGGTGSDFARLGLCCRTPEDALRVLCDGLARELSSVASTRMGDDDAHIGSEGCMFLASSSPTARQSTSAPFRSSSCAAHAVDIGRIEFLRTGKRHFFINECSARMSCDVIQRAERFKRYRWISLLGGLVLFAASSFISLVLMKPKPLYICKLPPRVPLPAAPAPWAEDANMGGRAAETDASHEPGSEERSSVGDNYTAEVCSTSIECQPISRGPLSVSASTSPLGWPRSLASLAPFSPLKTQLSRLRAQLRCEVYIQPRPDAPGHHPHSSCSTCAHDRTRLAAPEAHARNGAAAYTKHARTPMPPLHAKKVRCTLETPSHEILKLLDISPAELEVQRMQQAERDTGASAVTSSTDFIATVPSGKSTGWDATRKGTAAVTTGVGEEHGHMCYKLNVQIGSDEHIRGCCCRVSSSALHVDPSTGTGDDAWPHDVKDDHLMSLTWVEMPSSMVAFANGRWYGGGMLVAPHANPTDGLLSCTNWVATILPFVLGVFSLYTGRHVHWRSTSAFDGERFLIANEPLNEDDATLMEADGEVLEAAPAIVELAGKLIFLVPSSADVCLGKAAPHTTRERLDMQTQQQEKPYGGGTRLFSPHCGVAVRTLLRRLHGLRDRLDSFRRRLTNQAPQ
ncbi:hypothetical protein, conserved [Leishmania tarentolae]|uniref:DAGKc domain-containing protein n=1 Tax=Leishmania tarentolae TaxID=5689 RepID=A0A640KE79_LEITA|nr:hypothetical protein, conserved [Leishmania tarentolae]